MMGIFDTSWLFFILVLAVFGAVIYGISRLLPKGRWRTGPVTIGVFLVGLLWGGYIDAEQVDWGAVDSGRALLVRSMVVMGAVAFALMPAALALIWCAIHNRRLASREET
jgi:hypothetical protein